MSELNKSFHELNKSFHIINFRLLFESEIALFLNEVLGRSAFD